MNRILIFSIVLELLFHVAYCQSNSNVEIWHNQERTLRYFPSGEDFVIKNGNKRFTRALYGTHDASRVEAGDLPEFALYMPGMAGNLQFILKNGQELKKLIKSDSITAVYRPGSMIYTIKDKFLGSGSLQITVLALSDNSEGIIVKLQKNDIPSSAGIFVVFGGASNKKFSRNGDIGADPESSFYLKPESCSTNTYQISGRSFLLNYGSADSSKLQQLAGAISGAEILKLADASYIDKINELLNSSSGNKPVLLAQLKTTDNSFYVGIKKTVKENKLISDTELAFMFEQAEAARKELANRVKVNTPDDFINNFGGALSVAADGIWDGESYMHGAVAWRMPLNGWRGAYVADPLGWHNRALSHFKGYSLSQYTEPASGPCVPDTSNNLARQTEKVGVSLFTSGYISRNPGEKNKPHHYDMNLVFIDELLTHFKWTGDTSFLREMWPVITRHLAWEKRNFDVDNDGLYDAYCCIWASDALQYSGGAVTHSSAYNYRANKMAAYLAPFIEEDPKPFQQEADKILKAIQTTLWLKNLGWYAEYKDSEGLKLTHSSAGLWTIYHSLDSEVPNTFEAYQSMRYIDNYIPHIPVKAKNLKDEDYYLLSTTNWMPYDWSLNNVVLAENLHTALANWQAGRNSEAYKLWKSAILESMYLGSSVANFQQISYYDAFRGELYRDFADPIGMAARSLVEGLFGIHPDVLSGKLTVSPGFPEGWDHASLHIPDIDISYNNTGNTDEYTIIQRFGKKQELNFSIPAKYDGIDAIYINNRKILWSSKEDAVKYPLVQMSYEASDTFRIVIKWNGTKPVIPDYSKKNARGDTLKINTGMAEIEEIYDPQQVISNQKIDNNLFSSIVTAPAGFHTVFIKVTQYQVSWWIPINIEIKDPVEINGKFSGNDLIINLKNNKSQTVKGYIQFNNQSKSQNSVTLKPFCSSDDLKVDAKYLVTGSNQVKFISNEGKVFELRVSDWQMPQNVKIQYKTIDLTNTFNDKVTSIFKNKYLSPRPNTPTLQLPVQGIGNWCYPKATANIDDSGLRKLAGANNTFTIPGGIPFSTPGNLDKSNIVFTSQWDNYPKNITIPLSGNASHAYLLMAGSANPMQSRMVNGIVKVTYTDGSTDSLNLINPETWWPIEQDYYVDNFAFKLNAPKPYRVHLKTGLITTEFNDYTTIKGFSNFAIDGGAATVLDLPLNPSKKLKSLKLETLTNDVVIGIMSVTLANF
jgi:hypothetical protein